ncbi:uncharacterized protein LOC108336443 isoform X3 [Vigna angularis]|uniref:uncharacterized protein LOC108336443 isoform X3 n=1 Tax=Phaseolus angularis TaxID=3914 RepID=UPI0022B588B7|nr:uncharacterized protein LOC108336443 isoform X3 [Vigna angularis]
MGNSCRKPVAHVSSTSFFEEEGDGFQRFWCELSPQARLELLRIDKQTLFEHARKNMYCSRCNGLLLEGFLQIVTYGKSLQQEGAVVHFPCSRAGGLKNQNNGGSSICNVVQDDIQDPSVHPWGGLTTTREGALTLLDCYLYSKSLKGLQIDSQSLEVRQKRTQNLLEVTCISFIFLQKVFNLYDQHCSCCCKRINIFTYPG